MNFRKEEDCIKTNDQNPGLLSEFEGTISGHRDGHGFVIRENGEADIYLAPNEMRAVLHGDRVKARVIRYDKRGRPEGRVLESGVTLVGRDELQQALARVQAKPPRPPGPEALPEERELLLERVKQCASRVRL